MAENVSEELARLAMLRDQGVLTEEEFQAQKVAVLRGDHPATPQAKSPGPAKSKIGKGCLILIAIVVVLIVIAVLAGGNPKTGPGKTNASNSNTLATPAISVTATELSNAYQNNEAAAQQTYGNKPLLVSGTIDGIDLDFSDKPIVKLRTANQFMSAQASLVEADQPKASGLSKGGKIKLLCGDVSEVIGTPMLKDCVIQ